MSSRRSVGNWSTNWDRSDKPVPLRALIALRNLSLRAIRMDTCCGHEGEPGC